MSIRNHLNSQRPEKKIKIDHITPILFGEINTSLGKDNYNHVKILLDSGASSDIICQKFVKKLRQKDSLQTEWNTIAGKFITDKQCNVTFKLSELNPTARIQCTMHVAPTLGLYDMILGRDTLSELGIDLKFSNHTIVWNDVAVNMKSIDATRERSFHVEDSEGLKADTDRIKRILDAKYKKANLKEIIDKEYNHLNDNQKNQLLNILKKNKTLFDGTLGKWTGRPYKIELKENAKPWHARPYPIPKIYESTLKQEVERLVRLGVLRKINRSEWAAPTFIIPKHDRTVRFISDFRKLNEQIKRKPFPIPKISDLLLKLEGFQWATSLDLNMGYYHIELHPDSKKLCTIVLPWGKYEYNKLPMGLNNSPDIFQEKMNELFIDLEYVRTYIDDLLVITKGSFENHLKDVHKVLCRMQEAGLKVNITKSFFAQTELEYLGYFINREGVMPIPRKVEAMKHLAIPKTRKQLRSFLGMINYYRDMWKSRSEVIAPLTRLTSKNVPFIWTNIQQIAFDKIKTIISKDVLLSYPDFSKRFDIHTDASDLQLGSVISQEGKPIAFFSRKLTPAQINYTTIEKELLAIVETLKEFRNILLGFEIKVYTDHQNLTYTHFNTQRVLRWRLILEEYGPTFEHIAGDKNIVADALSRLEYNEYKEDLKPSAKSLAELYSLDEEEIIIPITYKNLLKYQQLDKNLLNDFKSKNNYEIKSFHGAGKVRMLICKDDKIVVPIKLQKLVVQWYHTQLCHPGTTRAEETIRNILHGKV